MAPPQQPAWKPEPQEAKPEAAGAPESENKE
jgi:hypothetical protein